MRPVGISGIDRVVERGPRHQAHRFGKGQTILGRHLLDSLESLEHTAQFLAVYLDPTSPDQLQASISRFREHNLALFEKMHPHYKDRTKLIAVVKQGRQQFEEQMAQERALSVDSLASP